MNLYGQISDEKAVAGLLYGMNPKSVITYVADGEVAYGKALFQKDGTVKNVSAEGYKFAGVALFHQDSHSNYRGCYGDEDAVACINDGNIWVVLDEDVTPSDGANAYVIPSTGVFTTEANDGEDEPTAYILAGKFKSGAENGLALVELSK